MREIFKKIEGREWDNFNVHSDCKIIEFVKNHVVARDTDDKHLHIHSPADMLANKSLCKAFWGECSIYHSYTAFLYLQQEGEEACLKYIKETII